MKTKPVMCTAKGIGEHELRSRLDEGGVEPGNIIRTFDVPEFRRVACLQAKLEIVGAGGAVSDYPPFFRHQLVESGHVNVFPAYALSSVAAAARRPAGHACYRSASVPKRVEQLMLLGRAH